MHSSSGAVLVGGKERLGGVSVAGVGHDVELLSVQQQQQQR